MVVIHGACFNWVHSKALSNNDDDPFTERLRFCLAPFRGASPCHYQRPLFCLLFLKIAWYIELPFPRNPLLKTPKIITVLAASIQTTPSCTALASQSKAQKLKSHVQVSLRRICLLLQQERMPPQQPYPFPVPHFTGCVASRPFWMEILLISAT